MKREIHEKQSIFDILMAVCSVHSKDNAVLCIDLNEFIVFKELDLVENMLCNQILD